MIVLTKEAAEYMHKTAINWMRVKVDDKVRVTKYDKEGIVTRRTINYVYVTLSNKEKIKCNCADEFEIIIMAITWRCHR